MPNERLERIKDVFVFACLTGLSFSDMEHLRKEHVITDEIGNKWVLKPRKKTTILSSIPLLPHPTMVLEKYKKIGQK